MDSVFLVILVSGLVVLVIWLVVEARRAKEREAEEAKESERKRLEELALRERRDARHRREEEEARFEGQYTEWFRSHLDLISKFILIAERKVSRVDEYGDENWDALDKEILAVTKKIAKADGYDLRDGFPRAKISHIAGSTAETTLVGTVE